MGTVTNLLEDPAGRPLQNVTVRINLIAPANPFLTSGSGEVVTATSVDTDATGAWSCNLVPNSQLDLGGAYYVVDETAAPGGLRWPIAVPDGPGPFRLRDLLVILPPSTDPNGPVQVRFGSYVYEQVMASSRWTILHDLGYPPAGIRVVDTAGAVWMGFDVIDVTNNLLILDLGVSMAGTATVG